MTETTRPAPIRVGHDNQFATDTMGVRVPGILRDVQAAHPDYAAAIMRRLDRLHDALVNGDPIPMLPLDPAPEPDHAEWLAAYEAHRAKFDPLTWANAEWFFAETFLYRHLIHAVRWFETGRDPFATKKREELHSDRLRDLLRAALAVEGSFHDRLFALVGFALWGNRVDLSHPAGLLAADSAQADDLLADDREALLATLVDENGAPNLDGGPVHIIADNAGSELVMDLVLADLLLESGSPAVVIHVKSHPTFVSDATASDVWATLNALAADGGTPVALVGRLRAAWDTGQFVIMPHRFWTSSHFLWDLPPELHRAFASARLVILKGDANYRRMVGDALWPEHTPFANVVAYFPAPLMALRSLKSDTVVGLPEGVAQRLDSTQDGWRVGGQYGVIQFAKNGS